MAVDVLTEIADGGVVDDEGIVAGRAPNLSYRRERAGWFSRVDAQEGGT